MGTLRRSATLFCMSKTGVKKPESPSQPPPPPTVNSNANPENPQNVKRRFGLAEFLSTLAVVVATTVGIGQYFLVRSQLDVMQTDERAWVVFDFSGKPDVHPTAGVPLTGQIHFSNSGKTPARSVLFTFRIEYVKPGAIPSLTYDTKSSKLGFMGALFPNEPQTVNISTPESLTDVDFKNLAAGKSFVAEYGEMKYQDVFGIEHWNKFCTWLPFGPPGPYLSRTCVEYNDVDNNYTLKSWWKRWFPAY